MLKNILVALTGLISLIYLLNPSAGFLEFIPDSLPLVGNLDEAAATALLIAALRYFGADLSRLFARDPKPPPIDLAPEEYKGHL